MKFDRFDYHRQFLNQAGAKLLLKMQMLIGRPSLEERNMSMTEILSWLKNQLYINEICTYVIS